MIKLTTTQPHPHLLEIRLEGRLDSHAAAQLADLVGSLASRESIDGGGAGAGGGTGQLALDLSGLTSIDADGCSALLALRGRGVTLHGGSLYVTMLLKEAQS